MTELEKAHRLISDMTAAQHKQEHAILELTADLKEAKHARDGFQCERDMAREEVARLTKLCQPQWYYLGDDQSSDQCRFGVHEVIDEDFLWDHKGQGSHIVEISTATSLPTIYALVHFFTDEEKDGRQSDDDYELTEFSTRAEAEAALSAYQEGRDG